MRNGGITPNSSFFWTNEDTNILHCQDMQKPIMCYRDKLDEVVTQQIGIGEKYWKQYPLFLISNRGINSPSIPKV